MDKEKAAQQEEHYYQRLERFVKESYHKETFEAVIAAAIDDENQPSAAAEFKEMSESDEHLLKAQSIINYVVDQQKNRELEQHSKDAEKDRFSFAAKKLMFSDKMLDQLHQARKISVKDEQDEQEEPAAAGGGEPKPKKNTVRDSIAFFSSNPLKFPKSEPIPIPGAECEQPVLSSAQLDEEVNLYF